MTKPSQKNTQAGKAYPEPFPPIWASEWGEDIHGLWAMFSYKDIEQIFRWIPAGEFMMGSPEDEDGRYPYEDLHQVTLTQGFWLADTTVTQAFWFAVMGENSSYFSDNKQNPVEQISWEDAQQFLEKINQIKPELNARLPYEAEWEYACRAGTTGAFNFEGELSLDKVNYRGLWEWKSSDDWGDGAKQATVAVKSMKNPNTRGLHEMHGNVWEWCQDYWQDNLAFDDIDPKGASEGSDCVVRGGSWFDVGGGVRSACRNHYSLVDRNYRIGFRLLLGHASQATA